MVTSNLKTFQHNLNRGNMGQTNNQIFVPDSSCELYLPLWWGELDGSPITSRDVNARSCTVTGAVYGADGRTFDASDDKITMTGTDFDIQVFSILGWIKRNTDGAINYLFSDLNATPDKGYGFRTSASDELYFFAYKASGFWDMTSTGTVPQDTWYMWGVTLGGNGTTAKMYIDGEADGTGSQVTIAYDSTEPQLGEAANGGGDTDGVVGELWFYSRELPAEEIRDTFARTRGRYK